MNNKSLTVEQIVVNLWETKRLVATGKTVVEACQKVGISEANYQRWLREHDGEIPAHIKSLEAFKSADKSGDIIKMLDSFLELVRHGNEGHAAKETGFALSRKLSILNRAYDMRPDPDKKTKVKFSTEVWERAEAGSSVAVDKIHEAIKDEFRKIIRFYLAYAEKTNQPVEGGLVSNISVNVKGDIGEQVSAALLSYFSGYELPNNQLLQLETGWQTLGANIEQLVRRFKV